MPSPTEESQLEASKMSFGEHLEELRRALFKSIIALAIGTAIGLFFGADVVEYVQGPLRKSLVSYYQNQDIAKEREYLESQQDPDLTTPEELDAAAEEMAKARLVPQDYYMDPADLARSLAEHYPELNIKPPAPIAAGPTDANPTKADPTDADASKAPAMDRKDMVHLRLYLPREDDLRLRVVELNVQSPFVIYMKASFMVGFVLASPFVFYFIWEFIAAGLYASERSYVYMYLPICLGLFFAGAALAYFKAFEYMLEFLFWFNLKMDVDPDIRLSEWMSLVLLMPLGFGVSFQLPLVMLLLQRIGIFQIADYISKWRISVVVIAVLSMVLTPGGDLGSMMLMFLPLTVLYFLGILMCKYMPGGPLRSPLRNKVPPAKPEQSAGS
jgi:sec-independent protein translocase protein TatC